MIHKTYKCNLCLSVYSPENLIPVEWRGANLVRSENRHDPITSNHLCLHCIGSVAAINASLLAELEAK